MPVECLVPWEDYEKCQHSQYSLEHSIYDSPFSIYCNDQPWSESNRHAMTLQNLFRLLKVNTGYCFAVAYAKSTNRIVLGHTEQSRPALLKPRRKRELKRLNLVLTMPHPFSPTPPPMSLHQLPGCPATEHSVHSFDWQIAG